MTLRVLPPLVINLSKGGEGATSDCKEPADSASWESVCSGFFLSEGFEVREYDQALRNLECDRTLEAMLSFGNNAAEARQAKKRGSPVEEVGTVPWPEEHVACRYCLQAMAGNPRYDVADLGEGLFLCSRDPACCPYFLKRLGITHVVRVMSSPPEKFSGFQYLTLSVEDIPIAASDLAAQWAPAFDFVLRATKQANGKVLVHCRMGISRSATLCIAYLMKKRGFCLEDACRYVAHVRPFIHPNDGFQALLRKFEQTLRSEKQVRDRGVEASNPKLRSRVASSHHTTSAKSVVSARSLMVAPSGTSAGRRTLDVKILDGGLKPVRMGIFYGRIDFFKVDGPVVSRGDIQP